MNEAQGLTIFLKHLLLVLEDAAVLTSSEITRLISPLNGLERLALARTLRRNYGTALHLKDLRNETARQSFSA
jgi:hypothetical protein